MWTPFQPRHRKSSSRKTSRRTRAPRLEALESRLALATYLVTTTDDGDATAPAVGTLRAAIVQANLTPEHDTINFSVSGTISPLVPLPAITNPVTIDGVGRSITLDGSNAGFANGLLILADGCTVRNLTVTRFSVSGILIHNGSSNLVEGNQITLNGGIPTRGDPEVGIAILELPGGSADFNTVRNNTINGNATGLGIGGGASDNLVSGNTISNNILDGVFLFSDADVPQATVTSGNDLVANTITGNANGIAVYGGTERPINLGAMFNTIENNTITNNRESGVLIDGFLADSNQLFGNTIRSNSGPGVRLSGGADSNTIGGLGVGNSNSIHHNGGPGVMLQNLGYDFFPGFPLYLAFGDPTGNTILRNSIHNNGGQAQIDLKNDGITFNDPNDSDSGPNNLQNWPVITVARSGPSTFVAGILHSLPGTFFTLDFYAGSAAGLRWLDSLVRATDGSGNVSFDGLLDAATVAGEVVTATATDPIGNTSEFSIVNASVTDLIVTGTAAADTYLLTGHGSGAVEVFRNGVSEGMAAQVSISDPDGADTYTVNFGPWTGNVNLSDTGSTGTDTVNFNGTAAADQFNKQFTFVEWNLDATPSAISRVDYAGMETKNVFGRDGNDTIIDPGEDTYLFGGAGDDTITIDATSGSGVVVDGGEGSDSYVVMFGNLAGPVTVADSGTTGVDSLTVQGTAGDDAIALVGDEVQRGAERVIVAAPVAHLVVEAGDGTDSITVGDFTAPIDSLGLDGGAGTNAVSITGSLPPGVELDVVAATQTVDANIRRRTVNVSSRGQLSVVLYATPTFDASNVDIGSVVFAGAHAVKSRLRDVDRDGDLDLVLKFRIQDTDLLDINADLLVDADQDVNGKLDRSVPRRQTATLAITGRTLDDHVFQGFDTLDLFLSGKSLRELLRDLAATGRV